MNVVGSDTEQLHALEDGRAFVDLSRWRKVRVSGSEAIPWLHDLLTADVAGLTPGAACRSLLLTPTGRIRADIHVARRDDVMLLQDPRQREDIGLALASYVLSSDVLLEDRSDDLALFAVPGGVPPSIDAPEITTPSTVGPGSDVLTPAGDAATRFVRACLGAGLDEAGPDALEAFRIRRGVPRMGADFDERSRTAEAGLEHLIDVGKGCFLGQESVARVRNLGHPTTVLRHLRVAGSVHPGDAVVADGIAVGQVTSATGNGDVTMIARVRWGAADTPLTLADGATVIAVPPTV